MARAATQGQDIPTRRVVITSEEDMPAAGFQTISYFIRWLTKVIVHRLLLHPWGNNLWDDAWRHKNRLREGIFGEYEELAIVKNAANKPAQHSRGDIRLGEKGAEA